MDNMAGYIAVGVTLALFLIVVVNGVIRNEKELKERVHRKVKEEERA